MTGSVCERDTSRSESDSEAAQARQSAKNNMAITPFLPLPAASAPDLDAIDFDFGAADDEPDDAAPLDEQRAAVRAELDRQTTEQMSGRPVPSAVVADCAALSEHLQKLRRRHWRVNRI